MQYLLNLWALCSSFVLQGQLRFVAEETADFELKRLRFYMADVQLLQEGKLVHKPKEKAYLLDLSQGEARVDWGYDGDYDSLSFTLGVDSLLHEQSDMRGALSPVKGMYWAWNSGYINFKLEGKLRGEDYVYHIGGYKAPYATAQRIGLAADSCIKINYNALLEVLEKNKLMSPGPQAKQLADQLPLIFRAHAN